VSGLSPLKGAPLVARQSRFHGGRAMTGTRIGGVRRAEKSPSIALKLTP